MQIMGQNWRSFLPKSFISDADQTVLSQMADWARQGQTETAEWAQAYQQLSLNGRAAADQLKKHPQLIGKISTAGMGLTGTLGKIGSVLGSVALNVGAMMVFEAVATFLYNLATAEERAAEAGRQMAKEYEQSSGDIEQYKQRAEELQKSLQSGNLSYDEAKNVRAQLLGIQDEIVDKYGNEAQAIDLLGGSLNNANAAWERLRKNEYRDFIESVSAPGDFGAPSALQSAKNFYEGVYTSLWQGAIKAPMFSGSQVKDAYTAVNKALEEYAAENLEHIGIQSVGTYGSALSWGSGVEQQNDLRTLQAYIQNGLIEQLRPTGIDEATLNSVANDWLTSISGALGEAAQEEAKHSDTYEQYLAGYFAWDNNNVDEKVRQYHDQMLAAQDDYRNALVEGDEKAAQEAADRMFAASDNFEAAAEKSGEKTAQAWGRKFIEGYEDAIVKRDWTKALTNAFAKGTVKKEDYEKIFGEGITAADLIGPNKGATEELNALAQALNLIGDGESLSEEQLTRLVDVLVVLGEVAQDPAKELEELKASTADLSEEADNLGKALESFDDLAVKANEGHIFSLSEMESALEILPELEGAFERVANGYKLNTDAIERHNVGIRFSAKEIEDLKKQYPGLEAHLDAATNSYYLEADALAKLQTSASDAKVGLVRAQIEMTDAALEGARSRIAALSEEISLYSKMASLTGNAFNYTQSEFSARKAAGSKDLAAFDNYQEYVEAMVGGVSADEFAKYKNLKPDIDKYLERINDLYSGSLLGGDPENSSSSKDSAKDRSKKIKDLQGQIDDYYDRIGDLNEQLADLDKEEKLDNLKKGIELVTLAIDALSSEIDVLDTKLSLTNENDFAARFGLYNQKLDLTRQKASDLRSEFARLTAIDPTTAAEAQELANRITEIGSELRSSVSDIVDNIHERDAAVLQQIRTQGENAKQSLEGVLDASSRLFAMYSGQEQYSMYGMADALRNLDFFLPVNDDELLDKEHQRNEILLADAQATEDAITEIKRKALELQYKENAENRAKTRADIADDIADTQEQIQEATEELQELLAESGDEVAADIAKTNDEIAADSASTAEDVTQSAEDAKTDITAAAQNAADQILSIDNATNEALVQNAKDTTALLVAEYEARAKAAADALLKTQEASDAAIKANSEAVEFNSRGNGDSATHALSAKTWSDEQLNENNPFANAGYYITSRPGPRKSTTGSQGTPISSNHAGTDRHMASGTALSLSIPTTFKGSGFGKDYGLWIELTDQNGCILRYQHLSQVATLKHGDTIPAGTVFAYSGKTGNVTGAHLHEEYYSPEGKNITGDYWRLYAPKYADGTASHPGGLALVGENHKSGREGGPELAVYPNGNAELLGVNGPGIYDLPKGTEVINHDDTKRLLRRMPRYAEGTYNTLASLLSGMSDQELEALRVLKAQQADIEANGPVEVNANTVAADISGAAGNGALALDAETVRAARGGLFETLNGNYSASSIIGGISDLIAGVNNEIAALNQAETPDMTQIEALTRRRGWYSDLLDRVGSIVMNASAEALRQADVADAIKSELLAGHIDLSEARRQFEAISDSGLSATLRMSLDVIAAMNDVAEQQAADARAAYERLKNAPVEEFDMQATMEAYELWQEAAAEQSAVSEQWSNLAEEYVSAREAFYKNLTADDASKIQALSSSLDKLSDIEADIDRSMTLNPGAVSQLDGLAQKIRLAQGGRTLAQEQYGAASNSLATLLSQREKVRADLGSRFNAAFAPYGIALESLFNEDGSATGVYQLASSLGVDNDLLVEAAADWGGLQSAIFEASQEVEKYADNVADYAVTIDEYEDKMRSTLYDEIAREADKVDEALQKQIDHAEYLNQLESKRLSAMERYHSESRELIDDMAEYNADLETSKLLGDWLDPEAREQLFNESDYNAMSEAVSSYQDGLDEAYRRYCKQIASVQEGQEDMLAIYEQEYNDAIEAEKQKYDLTVAELDVAKKRRALENAVDERTVRQYVGGRWVYTSNAADVQNAQKALAQSTSEVNKQKRLIQDTREESAIQGDINYNNKNIAQWEYAQELLRKEIEEFADYIEELNNPVSSLAEVLDWTSNFTGDLTGLGETFQTATDIIKTGVVDFATLFATDLQSWKNHLGEVDGSEENIRLVEGERRKKIDAGNKAAGPITPESLNREAFNRDIALAEEKYAGKTTNEVAREAGRAAAERAIGGFCEGLAAGADDNDSVVKYFAGKTGASIADIQSAMEGGLAASAQGAAIGANGSGAWRDVYSSVASVGAEPISANLATRLAEYIVSGITEGVAGDFMRIETLNIEESDFRKLVENFTAYKNINK